MGSEGLQERVFNRLFEAAEIARFSRKELVEYEDSLKVFRDWYSVMKTTLNKGLAEGRAKGLAEGLAEGRAEGLAEGKIVIARQMKADGMPADAIARYTGLSLEEINKL